jgi:Mrp family chromosome partitioning ATPase
MAKGNYGLSVSRHYDAMAMTHGTSMNIIAVVAQKGGVGKTTLT